MFKNAKATLIATITFAILYGLPTLEGNIANAENFMILPIIIGALLIFSSVIRQLNLRTMLIAGILLGIAFLYKIVGIFDFAAFFAFLLPVLAKKFSRPMAHLISLFAGGIGLISLYFFADKNMLIISMAGIGLAWCSILAMPYAILTQALPANKMGVYMGIFNFFIVIPQILAATILGMLTKHIFHGDAIMTIVVGGCSMMIAGLLTLRIKDK